MTQGAGLRGVSIILTRVRHLRRSTHVRRGSVAGTYLVTNSCLVYTRDQIPVRYTYRPKTERRIKSLLSRRHELEQNLGILRHRPAALDALSQSTQQLVHEQLGDLVILARA